MWDGPFRGEAGATASYDLLGRVTEQVEKNAGGTTVYQRHSIVYDARGQVLAEQAKVLEGSDWHYTHTVNYYCAKGDGLDAGGDLFGVDGRDVDGDGQLQRQDVRDVQL